MCKCRLLRLDADTSLRAADKSARYVAEENIAVTTAKPSRAMVLLAGRYFKRWDHKTGKFISNVREEYPDD